jgi:hypothetical protein
VRNVAGRALACECEVSPVLEPGGTSILSYVINRRYYHLIGNYVSNQDQQQQTQRSLGDKRDGQQAIQQ